MRALVLFVLAACGPTYPGVIATPSGVAVAVKPALDLSCRQELGRDAGSVDASAHRLGTQAVLGCLPRNDSVDTYLIEVPDNRESVTYEIAVEAFAEITTQLRTDSDALIERVQLSGGQEWRRRIELAGGARYQVQIRQENSRASRYRVRATRVGARVAAN